MTSTMSTLDVARALRDSDLYAVFATDGETNVYRVSDPLSWDEAQAQWSTLDAHRRHGLLPQAKHYEVRAVALGPDRPVVGPEVRSHGHYDKAQLNLAMTRTVVGGRGFGKVQDAARAAWKLYYPTYKSRYDKLAYNPTNASTGRQGSGGWYFYPNGTTAAQGLDSLADVAKRRGLVTKGVDGRWYVTSQEQL